MFRNFDIENWYFDIGILKILTFDFRDFEMLTYDTAPLYLGP